MSEDELKELDAWIAEHVMGAKWLGSQLIWGRELIFKRERNRLIAIGYPRPEFSPTISNSDAMDVLEKCAESGTWPELKRLNKTEPIGHYVWYNDNGEEQIAPTLPLAICLFAKQLFRKDK